MGQHPNRRSAAAAIAGAGLLGPTMGTARAAVRLRIGQSLPLSGPLGPVVKPIAEGQRALLEDVNAAGGVRGTPVELVTLDDGARPDQTAANVRQLIETDGAIALFGFAFVPGLMKALPLVNEFKVPLIGVYNGADIARSAASPYLFTTTASLRDEVAAMVRNLASLHTTRLAVVYQNNDLGRFMLPLVEAIAREHQATLVTSVAAEPDGSNGPAAAAKVAAAEPQAVLLLAAGAAVIGFMKSMPAAARVPVYGLSLAGTTALLEQMGPAARGMAFTQVVPSPSRQISELSRRFASAMSRRGLPLTYDRLWGFLNASILVEVLRRAGATPSSAGIVSTLERMGEIDLGGYRLTYGPDRHHGSSFVEITMVDHNGKFIR